MIDIFELVSKYVDNVIKNNDIKINKVVKDIININNIKGDDIRENLIIHKNIDHTNISGWDTLRINIFSWYLSNKNI